MKNYSQKRKLLKSQKREAMKRDFKASGERNNLIEGFKKEYRSIKRSEKNAIKKQISEEIDDDTQ